MAAQRHLQDLAGIGQQHVLIAAFLLVRREWIERGLGGAAGPVQVHSRVVGEVGMQGDAQQPALGLVIDAESRTCAARGQHQMRDALPDGFPLR